MSEIDSEEVSYRLDGGKRSSDTCRWCEHQFMNPRATCKAFPEGIPDELADFS